jgi:hypothetical protein
MTDLVIVIPIGISSPGTPVVKFLEWCVESLKNQQTSYSYKVIFAADNNLPVDAARVLAKSGFDISLYEPYYFMRRGGIWKKIYTEWEKNESKYIAFSHYDDVWSLNKIQSQLSFMETNNLDLSWSKVQVINENNAIVSPDICRHSKLTRETIRTGSYAFSHSTIIKKDVWFNCGIADKVEKGSAIYEQLQFIYSHKLRGAKDDGCVFYHRTHSDSVSNQFNTEKDFMTEQRKVANYSLNEVLKDADELNVNSIIEEVEKICVS